VVADLFCTRCGHRNPDDSNFCSSCGSPLPHEEGDHPTINFQVDAASGEHQIEIDLGDVPAGGMLIVRSGPNAGSKFAVDKDVVTAGRHPDSDIFLDDITVSRRHVEVLRRPGGYVVRDVGSLNGTYVNRARVEEAPLTDGDELQVGKFKLVFVAGAGGEA
jgi:hypothetical protein